MLFFDPVDSSRLMSARQQQTVDFLQAAFSVFQECCTDHGGKLIKTTGDGALLLFDTASDALDYALDVQARIPSLPSALEEKTGFRAGVHVGEVLFRQGDVYGHAVNVAERLEAAAGMGEICVSAEVFALARHNARFAFEAIGRRRLKNIPANPAVYRVHRPGTASPLSNAGHVSISTVGGLRLESAAMAHGLTAEANDLAPIGYLALNPDAMEKVGRLCALFWPDRTLHQAQAALARQFRLVNDAFGEVFLQGATFVGLVSDAISVDLEDMERNLRMGQVDPLLLRSRDWPERILAGT